MATKNWYLSHGGGCGDVLWDFLHDKSSWRIASLAKDYGARIRVYTLCHNDGVNDLFRLNPYIQDHLNEPWHPCTPEDAVRFSNPIDNYYPLQQEHYFRREYGFDFSLEQPEIYLSPEEQSKLAALGGNHPLIVAQPFAGLSDRDGFDSPTFERLVEQLVRLEPNVRIVVVGKNHERAHKYSREELSFTHPNVQNLIDRAGIRFCWHLVRQCDAFIGCHSNLIRTAWDARKRNACLLPWPMMERHLNEIDQKYTYGFRYPESRRFTFPFSGTGDERQFDKIDTASIARWVLGRD
jgi:hypothetical protein